MKTSFPSTLPVVHRDFLARTIEVLSSDMRILGIAVAGSYADDAMDEFSDLDLTIAIDSAHVDDLMIQRTNIAQSLGTLLAAFTGEHVGEPRLLICLYSSGGSPPLHVDLKFVALPDAAIRVDEPVVVWERDGALSAALATGTARYPSHESQWIEDRFWVWIHYAAAKIGRGEYFETIEFLSFLRCSVLSPLALRSIGERPSGVRKLERRAPGLAKELEATIVTNDARSLISGLRAAIALYRKYRDVRALTARNTAEEESIRYLDSIEATTKRRVTA